MFVVVFGDDGWLGEKTDRGPSPQQNIFAYATSDFLRSYHDDDIRVPTRRCPRHPPGTRRSVADGAPRSSAV